MESDRAEIVACETCGGSDRDALGQTRGQRLLAALRAALADRAEAELSVASVRCLWACSKSCAVLLRSPRRVGYVIAGLDPSHEVARALLDYAASYRQSDDGAVPYKSWPPPLKGHFLCRIPQHIPPAQPNPEAEPTASKETPS